MPATEFRTISWTLLALRLAVGWHFLYEGLVKLLYPGWSSQGYLEASTGPLAPLFHWLAASSTRVLIVDQLNIWGLTLLGLALMLGLRVRLAALLGALLVGLYYLATPPLFAPATAGPAEGHYLLVNKNLIEVLALLLVAFTANFTFSLDRLFGPGQGVPAGEPGFTGERALPAFLQPPSRRDLIANLAGVPAIGAFVLAVLKKHGWKSIEEAQLVSRASSDVGIASPTLKVFEFNTIKDLKGRLPMGRIGKVTLSRMILGGNLIGGWAHARDLIYASKLVKAYHTREKVFETLYLAETCGINAILTNPLLCDVINDYWRNGGKIQFISDCGGRNVLEMIQRSIDRGACACYIQGGIGDQLVEQGRFDLIEQALELIRRNGLPAGIGGHKLETIRACVERGIKPDFWMKTLHHTRYWSARLEPQHDNIWCEDPEATIAFMKDLEEPWIAFKILAAGAIHPKEGFRYAFENGADFICVGMYDFQIVEDVNLALEILQGPLVRQRPWRA